MKERLNPLGIHPDNIIKCPACDKEKHIKKGVKYRMIFCCHMCGAQWYILKDQIDKEVVIPGRSKR